MFFRSNEFKKGYKKLPKRIQEKVDERLIIFSLNEFEPLLDNHKLNSPYQGYRSINVTGDYRVIYRKYEDDNYLLYKVGTHPQLYG